MLLELGWAGVAKRIDEWLRSRGWSGPDQLRQSGVQSGRGGGALWTDVQLRTGDDVIRKVLVLGREVQLLRDRRHIDAAGFLSACVLGEGCDTGAVTRKPDAGQASAEVAFGRRRGGRHGDESAD